LVRKFPLGNSISRPTGHGKELKDATKDRDMAATLLTSEQISELQKRPQNGLLLIHRGGRHKSREAFDSDPFDPR
jgi:hypothetical protein